jgi:hypothetical protein
MDQKVLNATISFFEEHAKIYQEHARVLKEFLQAEQSPITNDKKKSKAQVTEKTSTSTPFEEKGGKPKRKKAAQNGPKRALSGYQLFVQEKYKSCKEENPAVNSKELFSMLSKEWKSLEEGKKAAFLHKAEQLKLPVNSLVPDELPISETEHHDTVEVETSTVHHDTSDPDKKKKKKKKKKHSHENDHAEDSEDHNKERKKVWYMRWCNVFGLLIVFVNISSIQLIFLFFLIL